MLRVNRNRIPSLVFILGLILTYVELAENAIAATDDELAVIYQSKKYSHLIDVLAREEKESWNIEKSYLLFKTYNQLKDYNQSKRVLGFIEHNLPSGFENLLLFEKINLHKARGEKENILHAIVRFQGKQINPFVFQYVTDLLTSDFNSFKNRRLLQRSLSVLAPFAEDIKTGPKLLKLYADSMDYSDSKKGEALLNLWKTANISSLDPSERSIEKSIQNNILGFEKEVITHFESQRQYKNYSYIIDQAPVYLSLIPDKKSDYFKQLRKTYFHSMVKKRKFSVLINTLAKESNRSALGLEEDEALLIQFDLMVRKGDTKSAIAILNKIIKKNPRQNLDKKYISLGKYYFNKGYYKQALYFFNRLKRSESSQYRISDVNWYVWRSHFLLGNREELTQLAEWAYGYQFDNKELGARFCYWGYKLKLYRDGDLYRCYKQFPLTYYGLHSKYTSKQQIATTAAPIPASQVFAAAGDISPLQERQMQFLRFVYLLNETELADSIVRSMIRSSDSNMMLSLANMLLEMERYYLVQIIVESKFRPALEKSITGRRLLLPYFYPLAYDEEISQLEDKRSVPKTLILSVMREESHFNPEVKSVAGAVGLMQLMPNTAKYVGKGIGLKVSTASLVDPKLNLKLGSTYLKKLMKRYKGNLFYTLAAYNGGPTNVKRWIKKARPKDNDDFVESITFVETQNYVRRVMRTFYIYRDMYEKI